ncbi:MAG: hypothetical protein L0L02_02850, partial [Corynebacterium variabile]|nr:hypothetical protein [Corynebacterium variabile]
TTGPMPHAEVLDVMIDTVAVRSPDAGLVTSAQRRLDDSTATLAARGIISAEPMKLVEGGVS